MIFVANHRDFAKATIEVEAPGLLTTIQDGGRKGYQQYGMPVAGAMDEESYQLGQALVGNQENLGALECTLLPPTLRLKGAAIVAFTGADMKPTINGEPVPLYIPLLCHDGDVISGTFATRGVRMYIAFGGGLEVPLVNGSVATHTKAHIGGFHGRALRAGDYLPIKTFGREAVHWCTYQPAIHSLCNKDLSERCTETRLAPIRVVLASQAGRFTENGIRVFVSDAYRLTDRCDRMGFRLEGPPIEHIDGADIISDGTVLGSIQVPSDGQPIILMADRQTTGGYTKIGTVITPDLPRLSQLAPGESINFEIVSIDQAQNLYRAYWVDWQSCLSLARDQSAYVFDMKC